MWKRRDRNLNKKAKRHPPVTILPPSPRQCCVCFTELESTVPKFTHHCNHDICRGCVVRWVEEQANSSDSGHSSLKCAGALCKEKLNWSKVKFLIAPDVYTKLEVHDMIKHQPWRYKICPTPDCKGVLNKQHHAKLKAWCSTCNREACFECGGKFHGDWSFFCSGVKNFDLMLTVYLCLKSFRTKRCPGCHEFIEKNQGCDHMTCKCGFQFCWLCKATWVNGHPSRCRGRNAILAVFGVFCVIALVLLLVVLKLFILRMFPSVARFFAAKVDGSTDVPVESSYAHNLTERVDVLNPVPIQPWMYGVLMTNGASSKYDINPVLADSYPVLQQVEQCNSKSNYSSFA